MRLNIKQAINEPGRRFSFSEKFAPEGEIEYDIKLTSPATLEMEYSFSGDELEVCGSVLCDVSTQCDRCLLDISHTVDAKFEELFAKDNEDAYELQSDSVPLDNLVLDVICLNLPTKILCNDDCKGLCSSCGADLNTETCSCVITNTGPFSELAGMFKDDEEV